jgi:hypothetical protein
MQRNFFFPAFSDFFYEHPPKQNRNKIENKNQNKEMSLHKTPCWHHAGTDRMRWVVHIGMRDGNKKNPGTNLNQA